MKQHWMTLPGAFMLVATSAMTALAQAGDGRKQVELSAVYVEECGSCHVAFPPSLLGPDAWRALMAGLEKHFGSDASLSPARMAEIAAWVDARAGRRDDVDAAGQPAPRISKTRWFLREHRDGHDGITAGIWKSAAVNSPANCAACHRDAAQGDYSERTLRIPSAGPG